MTTLLKTAWNGKMIEGKRKTVLVTDASRGSAIAIIRSRGQSGWRVIAGDSDARSLGFRSRYVEENIVYPSPQTEAHDFIMALFQAVNTFNVDLIIPVTDEVIHPLTKVRSQFEEMCQLALPEATALEVTTNKNKTIELAKQLEIPVPQSFLVETVQEAGEAMLGLSWPVVLKPQTSRHFMPDQGTIESCSVSYANNMEELTGQIAQNEGRWPVLLQEYCQGTGYGVELLAFEGRPLAVFQHKRLAEIPLSGGASAWRESVPVDPQLYDYAVRLVNALSWTGLMMVEFKVGQRAVLMEINGRVWGSLPLAVLCGMDFPSQLADLYTHGPPSNGQGPVTDYQVGVRAFNLELICSWIPKVLFGKHHYTFLNQPKRREAVTALMGLFDPHQKLDIFSLEDPSDLCLAHIFVDDIDSQALSIYEPSLCLPCFGSSLSKSSK